MASRPRVQAPGKGPGKGGGNPVRDSALGLVPETLDAYLALNRAVWLDGPLPPAEIEIARLRNARRVGCVFCQSVRYDLARDDGLDETRIEQVADGFMDSDLPERDKLIIAFTDQFLTDPAGLSDALAARLRAAFSVEELAHLALAVAHFCGFSRCAVALGGMPDKLPLMSMSLPQ